MIMFLSEPEQDSDSDDDDLDRYTGIGLREQLFVTLSRTIPNKHDGDSNITGICDTVPTLQLRHTTLPSTNMQHNDSFMRQCTTRSAGKLSHSSFHVSLENTCFEQIHEQFATELKLKIFNNQLSNHRTQRDFMSITPQDIGLMDFYHIHTRKRATLGFNHTKHKPFVPEGHDSVFDIRKTQRDSQLRSLIHSPQQTHHKPWRKILSLGRKKANKHSPSASSMSLRNISDVTECTETKDDLFIPKQEKHMDSVHKTLFELNRFTDALKANTLKRGDVIFLMDYEMIDIQHEDRQSFVHKYEYNAFIKRMKHKDIQRRSSIRAQLQHIRKKSMHPRHTASIGHKPQYTPVYATRTRSPAMSPADKRLMLDIGIKETDKLSIFELEMLEDWNRKQSAVHCALVLQITGSLVEVAHVTSHGAMRSFIKQFDAHKLGALLYDNASGRNTTSFGRGTRPPVAYKCVVYRVNNNKLRAEAANVAENLIESGRVLYDPKQCGCSMKTYIEQNPEQYFDKFLLNNSLSLFRRNIRLQFDTGTHFMQCSSSEFVALCFQRALVNKKTFDAELIRLLDVFPHVTPPALLQKYLHLNIDRYSDWKCCGNVFFYYL
eukprot:102997_1